MTNVANPWASTYKPSSRSLISQNVYREHPKKKYSKSIRMSLRGFHTSSDTIVLKDKHILSSRCKRPDGTWSFSEIDLNNCLGNNNGKFVWGGDSFADSASQVHLALEGGEGKPMLHAQLNDRHGSVQSASVNLGECIQNEAGGLEYMHC